MLDGKCPLIFLQEGERLTAATYIKYLRERVFPSARETYGNNRWWQQDSVSCHATAATQQFLKKQMLFFFGKDMRPPHLCDLTPVDCAVFRHILTMLSGIRYI